MMSYRFNPLPKEFDRINCPENEEQYVPYGNGITYNSDGIKGQWSYHDGIYWICIANNTWLDIYSVAAAELVFAKITEETEQYVPGANITGPNSTGIKGQWSYKENYMYQCIATDTWVRYVVVTNF